MTTPELSELANKNHDSRGRFAKGLKKRDRALRIKNIYRALYHAGIITDKEQRLAIAHKIAGGKNFSSRRMHRAFAKMGVPVAT